MKKNLDMKATVTVIFLLIFSLAGICQSKSVPLLERRVTIEMQNETVEALLTEISRQAETTFSYSPEALNASRRISLSLEKQTVRSTLNTIFDGMVTCRERGKFIILQPVKEKKEKSAIVEGYLTNAQGNLLTDATVYNAEYKTAVTTNEYGYFHLEMGAKNTPDTLKVSKRGFEEALLMPVPGKTTFVNLTLPGNAREVVTTIDSADFFPSKLVNHQLQVNSSNVTETFNSLFQLSFVPHVGTNSLLSGSTINLFSLNILGGYIESVKVFEAGGLMNIVRRDAGVFQSAGLMNFVGGKFNGVQSAGLLNVTRKNYNGIQLAGVSNTTGGDFNGVQSSGIMNMAQGNFAGVQATGLFNSIKFNCKGVQASGIMNYAREIDGAQMTGILNTAKKTDGLQLSGILNQTRNCKGAQIAGIINTADKLKGAQISGLINRARYIKGVQLGVVNIADSCSGAQIGIINICRKGYHQIDIYATETFYTNIAYRGGTKHFYTILMGGYDPRTIGSSALYTFGAGIGTSFGKKPKLNYEIDLLSQQVSLGSINDDINMLYRLGFGVNYKMARNIALTLGLTYNFYLVDSSSPDYETTFSKLSPYFISNESAGINRNLKTWIGFKAGVRLF
jgi:hypothetical protein